MEPATSAQGARPEPLIIRPTRRWTGFGLLELWRFRELLAFFTLRDLKVRYKQTVLGAAWAVVQPILYMVVFTLFFGKLANLYNEGKPYALLALAGSVIWLFFSNSVNLASTSLVTNASMITKVYFPRLLAAIAPVLAGLVDLVLSFMVLLIAMAVYGLYPGFPRLLVLVPFLLLALGTAVGIGAWLAALNVKYRDIRFVVPFMLQLWLFASPVVYSSRLLDQPWRTVYALNPMAGVVEGFRWATLGGVHPSVARVALSTLGGGIVLLAGLLYFRRVEETLADIV